MIFLILILALICLSWIALVGEDTEAQWRAWRDS